MKQLQDLLRTTQLSSQLKLFLQNRTEEEIASDEIYLNYPELFADSFKQIKQDKIDALNVSGFLYYKSVLLLDGLIDDKTTTLKAEQLFLSNKLQEESIKLLTSVFSLDKTFWELWNIRQQEYFKAIQLEKQLALKPNYKKYQQVADYKAAFGKVAIDCLYVLSGKKDIQKYNDLLQSHYHFSVGLQLIDDLQDLEEDIKNNQFNWVYYQTISLLKKENYDIDTLSIPKIKKLTYLKGIAISIRKESLKQLQKSKQIAKKYNSDKWILVIEKQEKEITHAIDQIDGYMQLTATKIKLHQQPQKNFLLPKIPNNDIVIKKGLDYILSQWKQDYPELKHLMYLSTLDGFSGKSKVHIGDVFQRAMVTNSLLEIQNNLKIDLKTIIEKEVHYLLNKRLKTRVGAWSYFPSCPEIAADADDLGEIIQVFNNSENKDLIDTYCIKPAHILLKDRIHDNNGIETWIIPKEKLTRKEERQVYFNTSKWGVGPDNEVMANFLYGLALYDKEKYKEQISKSCKYLFKHQSKDGFWDSRWYYGNYYGTYACLRLFSKMKIQNNQLKKTAEYIKNKQNKDGGWGVKKISDPLNTAFAMLCLSILNKKVPKNGIEYLYQNQQPNGSWVAVSFIKPRTNEPYKSSTLTTAIVLRALTSFNH